MPLCVVPVSDASLPFITSVLVIMGPFVIVLLTVEDEGLPDGEPDAEELIKGLLVVCVSVVMVVWVLVPVVVAPVVVPVVAWVAPVASVVA
jgi:hypothetical protein